MELADALDFIRPRRHGVVVALKREGRAQLSNISYLLGNDGLIRISVTDARAKTAILRRDPRVALHVTRDDFYAYVVIEGTAELSAVATSVDDAVSDNLVELYRSLAGEHSDWAEFRAAMVAERRLVLRIRPERAYGMLV